MADALRDLHAKQGDVKFLGSYPAIGEHAHTAREHAEARWREADDWMTELRSRITRERLRAERWQSGQTHPP